MRDLSNSTYPQKVDIVAAGEVINVSLCGNSNVDTVSVTILDPSNATVYSSGDVPSNVDCADPFTAPLTAPIRYTTTTSGVFTVQLESVSSVNLRRFDITVTPDALTNPDPSAAGGRLWAYGWRFDADTFGQVGSTDANYYALVPGGRPDTNYVWVLDLNNFAGYVYTLVANDLGVDAPYSGYSTPRSGRTVTAKFPQYMSYPVIADPRPTEPPVLTGGLTFIDDAGQDYAISPVATGGIQDSGNFEFTSDIAGTYAITIDTNSNGVYGAGDKLLLGNMVAGLNQVSWDGAGANGVVLADGQYSANLQVRLGEYHFVARDAETSGGTEDGLTIFLANSDGSVVDTTVYWDDTTFLAGSSNLPDGALASTPAGKHTWGNFTATSIGNEAYMDTYVYGLSSTYTALTAIVSDDTLQTGTDGLLTVPGQSDSGGDFTIIVNDADINVIPSVAETVTVVVANPITGEQEQVSLTETGINTGVFSRVFSTVESAVAGVNNDGSLNVMPGNDISVTYFDQLDLAGASVSRVEAVGMLDVTAPVITLIGSDPISIELGSTYTDAGATASDNIDGDLSGNIVTVNPVDTNTVGSYTVTYNVTDAAGNNATEVTRVVNVTADVTVPVITLIGSDPVSIEQGETYTDAGATASDNIDGDLTGSIVTVNPVDTNTVGSYTVTYNVTDAEGNAAIEVTRTVNVTFDPLADADGDGVNNGDEGAIDSDGDGIANYLDLDSDNDGIPDLQEGMTDGDADGVPDFLDIDSDNDGLSDLTESGIANPRGLDADNDGRIDSDFGDNGLADVVENAFESGEINYNIADSDSDGVNDFRDLDSDNDGLNDVIESAGVDGDNDGLIGSGVVAVDTDGAYLGVLLPALDRDDDGVANFRDLDSDNDGLFDVVELNGLDSDGDGMVATAPDVDSNGIPDQGSLISLDTDSDGVADYLDLDSDNDGIPDVTEVGGSDDNGDGIIGSDISPVVNAAGIPNGGPLPSVDTDNDGLANYRDLDSDNDGGYDLVEGGGQDSDNNGLIDGFVDTDGNGFDDGLEQTPLPFIDSDGDGTPDFRDRDDTDNDGVSDYLDRDDDNDGIPDIQEGDGAVDSDGDSIPDSRDLDSDNDGIYDLIESGVSNPTSLDSDGDGIIDDNGATDSNGLADAVENTPDSGIVNYNGGTPVDSDGDGIEDFRDLDSDNDGISDVLENGGSDPDSNGTIGTGSPVAVNSHGVAVGVSSGVTDSDGDGLADYLDVDANNDGIFDLVEVGGSDSNGDGMIDGFVDIDGNGFDDGVNQTPLPHLDTDGDAVLNHLDLDDDNDGIPDLQEGGGTVDSDGDSIPDSRDLDSDNNGISDLIESGVDDPLSLDSDNNGMIDGNGAADTNGLADIVESSPDSGIVNYNGGMPVDRDGDGLADYLDVDADNDGVFDLVEVGGVDSDGNGRVDDYTDANGDGYDDNAISSLAIVDLNNNGLPDYLESERSAVKTGLKGVGGCSAAGPGTTIDPTLPLLLLFSMLALMGGNIRKVLFGGGR
ncbi:MAG: DUF5011 domain-containing protein [Gammaproteobacteria bacterium]|nr:DUF5011 domain-containing protein [Gammaproteobacteria bacterium]